jgi:hypothetical protein
MNSLNSFASLPMLGKSIRDDYKKDYDDLINKDVVVSRGQGELCALRPLTAAVEFVRDGYATANQGFRSSHEVCYPNNEFEIHQQFRDCNGDLKDDPSMFHDDEEYNGFVMEGANTEDANEVFNIFRDECFSSNLEIQAFGDGQAYAAGRAPGFNSSPFIQPKRIVTFDEDYNVEHPCVVASIPTPSPQPIQQPSAWLHKELSATAPTLPPPPSPKAVRKNKTSRHDRNCLASELTKHKHWTEEEDNFLKFAVDREQKRDWRVIAEKYFDNARSAQQCKVRWKNHLKPGIVRGNWRPHEDRIILNMVLQGKKWAEIAHTLPGRIGENVRQRFVNVLDPRLKQTPWTEAEDRILFENQRILGNKWSEIRKLIPGRSENSIKNRYHNRKNAHLRKMKQKTESIPV